MQDKLQNKKGGFIQLIILIIVALVVLKFLNLSISDVLYWFKSFFAAVLK